jgi:hypothetical protein
MDVVLDGYARFTALRLWRDYETLLEAHDRNPATALAEAGHFTEMGRYRGLWLRPWRSLVVEPCGDPSVPLYGRVEAAVREALREERAARLDAGDSALEDTPLYRDYVAQAMGQLLEEASASSGEPG